MDLEQQLHAALSPREPGPGPLAAVMAHLSAAPARGTRRNTSRTILLGTLFAVAAAASMLALRLADRPVPHLAVAAATSPAPIVAAEEIPSATTVPAPQPAKARAVEGKSEPRKLVAAARPFTVRVLPLNNEATTGASRLAIESFHAALLQELRAVPGLVLVLPDTAGFAPDAPTDYRFTLRGSGPMGSNGFVVMLRAEAVGRLVMPVELHGTIGSACEATGAAGCGDPAGMAAMGMKLLRNNLFPGDPAVPQDLRAKILDASLDPATRLTALGDLRSLQTSAAQVRRFEGAADALGDAAIAHSLANLAVRAPDPGMRAQVWRSMRGAGNADLVEPLLDSLRTDRDDKVRVEAATTLAADFAGDEHVRAVLEAVAQEDPRPMVRALARRGVSGESAWNEYVVSSLKDQTLPAAQRLDALFHTVNQVGKVPDLRTLLNDDEAVLAFIDAYSAVQKSSPPHELPYSVLVTRLGSIDHPAITGLLIDSLQRTSQSSVRQSLVSLLGRRLADDRVRRVLETLSTTDGEMEVRALADMALKASASTAVP